MVCKKCNHENDNYAFFCVKCGDMLIKEKNSSKCNDVSPFDAIVVGLLIILVISLFGWIVVLGSDDKKKDMDESSTATKITTTSTTTTVITTTTASATLIPSYSQDISNDIYSET